MSDNHSLKDPRTLYPAPPFPQQHQARPGIAAKMQPEPDHGEKSYQGCNRLAGRRALITGGDSGIGRAAAIAFAREGADVAISYLPEEEEDAQSVIALIRAEGRKAVALPGDISDEGWCRDMVAQAARELDGLDILVINAGRQQFRDDISELSSADFDKTMKTNLYALHWMAQTAAPLLPAGAAVITTASIQAYQPSEILLDYATTKAGIVAYTKALAKQFIKKGVRVNAVAPGPVWTVLQPSGGQPDEKVVHFGEDSDFGRPGQPVELAPIYVFLASNEASFINGEVYGATGGKGIRVVEFVHMVMGPTCGLVLADLGAEVIKVEPTPAGDNTRRLTGSGAGYWMTYNRNKKSFAVDIKTEEGMAAVRKLIESADVVTENFRPGAMEKLGLGFEQVKAIKPDVIYSSMKGFLPGPYEHRTALDEVVQMMSGLAYMTGPEGRPLRAGASVNDVMGGMFSAISILAALWQRKATGEGQFVQTGLFENSAFLVGQHMMQMATTGQPAAPMPSRLSAWAIYDVFNARDDEQVFMGVVSDSQWLSFCQAFGFEQLGSDPELARNTQRVHARSRILPLVRERLATLPKQQIMDMCEQAGLPFSPIQRPQDLFDDVHLNASGGLAHLTLDNGEEVKVPMLPFEMNGRRFDTRLNVPQLGSHSQALLEELGYAARDVDALRARGVVR